MRRVGVEWWNTHCFKGNSPMQMFLIERTLDGGWTEHDERLLEQWPMLTMTYSYRDIGTVVKCSTIIRKLLIDKHWRIKYGT